MSTSPQAEFPKWDSAHAANLDQPDLLLYRSNLLGSDLRITNYGGGNTSAKVWQRDPLTGENVEVLWVKGSGGDLGTLKEAGLAGPGKMPAAMAQRMNEDVNKVLAMPDVIEKLDQYGAEDGGGSAKRFADFIKSEQQKWGRVIRDAKVSIDA